MLGVAVPADVGSGGEPAHRDGVRLLLTGTQDEHDGGIDGEDVRR